MPSSVISAISYMPGKKILRIKYVSGSVYDYKRVPEEVYKAFKNAGSKGTYLNNNIKGQFEFEKIVNNL